MKRLRHLPYLDPADGGPICLYMIARHYGKHVQLATLRSATTSMQTAPNFGNLSRAADRIGLSSLPAQLNYQQLCHQAPLPCLIRWRQNEYAVVYRISRRHVYLADPARKRRRYPVREFLGAWIGESGHDSPASETQGEVLLLEPSPEFWSRALPKPKGSRFRLWWSRWTSDRRRQGPWSLDLRHEGED